MVIPLWNIDYKQNQNKECTLSVYRSITLELKGWTISMQSYIL